MDKPSLEKRRQLLLQILEDFEHQEQLNSEVARAESAGGDLVDIGNEVAARQLALSLSSTNRDMVHDVQLAIKKIDDGTYGICEVTGAAISEARLEAMPWARLSLEAQRDAEQGRKQFKARMCSQTLAFDSSDEDIEPTAVDEELTKVKQRGRRKGQTTPA